MTLSACPDSELLAACAEGRLHGNERERVLRHLTSCHDCYTVFTEALHLLDELPAMATADDRVPVARGHERAFASRAQPAKPSEAEPVTPRPLDGTTPGSPGTPLPSPHGQPGAAETPNPDSRGGEPRDNVIPFDRRRWRRVTTVALPLAAAAALTVVVMQQHPPQAPTSSPVTMAQAPPPQPTAVATPTSASAVESVRPELPQDAHTPALQRPHRTNGFGGGTHSLDTRCLYAGLMAVHIGVASRHEPEQAARIVRTAAGVLRVPGGDDLSAHFERLASEARAGRLPAAGDLRPAACPAALLDAARAVEFVRLAALTRDAALLRHPEVVAGLSAGRQDVIVEHHRSAFDALARLAASPPSDGDLAGWGRLRRKAEDLAMRWQP